MTFYGEAGSRLEPPKEGATSARARALAWRFAQANDELIKTLSTCTEQEWRAVCADTNWTVGVQSHHIAGVSLANTLELLRDNGGAAAAFYRELRDDQLARMTVLAPGAPPMTLADIIGVLAIGEIERHGAEIHEGIAR